MGGKNTHYDDAYSEGIVYAHNIPVAGTWYTPLVTTIISYLHDIFSPPVISVLTHLRCAKLPHPLRLASFVDLNQRWRIEEPNPGLDAPRRPFSLTWCHYIYRSIYTAVVVLSIDECYPTFTSGSINHINTKLKHSVRCYTLVSLAAKMEGKCGVVRGKSLKCWRRRDDSCVTYDWPAVAYLQNTIVWVPFFFHFFARFGFLGFSFFSFLFFSVSLNSEHK